MKNTYAVIDRTESFVESFFSDLVTFSFLSFCIWLSQGSRFWTFVTGLFFLLFALVKIARLLNLRTKPFKTKAELIKWADSLDWGTEPRDKKEAMEKEMMELVAEAKEEAKMWRDSFK